MRVEKIELIGFKSFAEKTTFQLHAGITCIVGPNGAGKSNIVDSFRWVLGEQSAKSLRGEKMEEVIFNGSATKKPRGMSEVSLLLSFDSPESGNGDSRTNTSVARRLYRSGDSEYVINREQCRLRDIKDLFLDTGLEVKSYSILEQGKIGEILNAKPEDRRFLIEEVAGVMKYKVRKAEALSKLESSRLNLQRINDIVTEVKRQINSLDRQVKKAERYKRLSAEVRSIELKLAKRDYTELRESLERISAEHTLLKEREISARTEINTRENTRETQRLALLEREKALEALLTDLQGIEREIAETERTIAVVTTERSNLTEFAGKLKDQESDISRRTADNEDRRGQIEAAEAGLRVEADTLREELNEKNELVRGCEGTILEKEELIERKRKEIFRAAEEISHLRSELGKLSTTIENLERKQESVLKEAESDRGLLNALETSLKDTDSAMAERNKELVFHAESAEQTMSRLNEQRGKLEELRTALSGAREGLASAASRLQSLQEILHEDLSPDILSEHLRTVSSLAELIEVDETHEKAIENTLFEKINGFIVQSVEELFSALPSLKEKGLKRTAFMPLNFAFFQGEPDSPIPDSGAAGTVIGRAADFVKVRQEFSSLTASLLRNVLIVKDLPSALSLLSLLPSDQHGITLVTLDGDTIDPSGTIMAGESKGILRRKRETREIEEEVSRKTAEIEHLSALMSSSEKDIEDQDLLLRETQSVIVQSEKELSLLRLTAEKQEEEKERLNRKISYLTLESGEISRETSSLKVRVAEKEAEISTASAVKNDAEAILSSVQEEIGKNREVYEQERATVADLRVSVNSLKERLESLGREKEAASQAIADLSSARERLRVEQADVETRITRSGEEIEKHTVALKAFVLRADAARQVISEQKETVRNESEDVLRIEQEIKTLRSQLDTCTTALSEVEVALAEHRLKLENLTGTIRQNYGLEVAEAETEPLLPEDDERLSDLRTKIQEMGPVNLGTLEEYEELQTRYQFLTQQQEDLTKSIAELEEAITKINSTTRKKLREAYEQLNTKFSEVFTMLFGGGKAGLVLTDENNILDSGIDIIAQPPGKKLQNIHLLSGGEKALAALALLFGSFLIKPSPLCILDEVDAALDDSNISRFAGMVRELAKNIQFIVVTHNRVTMEAADYIYGITMEEPGVSKVISMQLIDA